MSEPTKSRRGRHAAPSTGLGTVAVRGTVAGVGLATVGVAPAIAVPPTPVDLPPKIEGFAAFQGQRVCDPRIRPGVKAFRNLVLASFPGSGDLGMLRGCDVGGSSEHKDGRAWDWALNAYTAQGQAYSAALFDWLLGKDTRGNVAANARRLGVMYIVWNRHIWSADKASLGWRPYNGPSAHTEHVHFSFTWAGANAQTTFWKGLYPQRAYQTLPFPKNGLRQGSRGREVRIVREQLGLAPGVVFTPDVKAAVARFQQARKLKADGVVDRRTWFLLLSTSVNRRPAAVWRAPQGRTSPNSAPDNRIVTGSDGRPILEYGDRSMAWVGAAQRLLRLPVDGVFGPRTRSAVIAVQRQYRLTPDGIIGPNTWAAMMRRAGMKPGPYRPPAKAPARPAPARPTLEPGARGPWVSYVQRKLRVSPASGTYGNATFRAVTAFQRSHRLPADGVVGPRTWAALG